MHALDGLRAVAIMLVVGHHIGAPRMVGGFLGVDLFFVLSGFLIARLLLNAGDEMSVGRFYARRALRLLPAAYAMLLAYTVFVLVAGIDVPLQGVAAAALQVANWARAFEWIHLGGLDHAWSLSIEEQFYLLFPFLLAMARARVGDGRRLAVVLIALALLSVAWRFALAWGGAPNERIYNGLDTRADALLIGGALAAVFRRVEPRELGAASRDRLRKSAVVAWACLLVSATSLHAHWTGFGFGWFTVVAIASAVIIAQLVLDPGSLIARLLATRPMCWLGVRSYSVYLWHYPVFWAFRQSSWASDIPGAQVLAVIVAIALADLGFRLVERPGIALRERLPWTCS